LRLAIEQGTYALHKDAAPRKREGKTREGEEVKGREREGREAPQSMDWKHTHT
jgi:hypothetical protein